MQIFGRHSILEDAKYTAIIYKLPEIDEENVKKMFTTHFHKNQSNN